MPEQNPPPRFWPPVVIAMAGVAAYANSLQCPFTFDDQGSIADNPTIRHLWPIGSVLWAPAEAGTGGRPIGNLSFAVNYALGGMNVWGYHAVNIAIHIMAALALFGILRRTLERKRHLLAFAIALIWMLHPLQTEAVTYVSQRAESMMGLFYLLTLYCFIRFAGADGAVWGWLSVLCCLFGLATKEVMVTAPVVVLLYDRTFVSRTFAEAWKRRAKYYVGLASPWLLLGFLLKGLDKRSVGLGLGVDPWTYALTESRVLVRYLRLAVWPHPLIFDYGSGEVPHTWAVAPYVAAVLLLLAATAWLLFRPAQRDNGGRMLGFAGAWFFLILAPSSSVVAVAGQPMAEHRMYLPLAAVAAAIAWGLHCLLGRRSLPVLLALAATLGWLTWQRNETYRSVEGMWIDTLVKRPDNERAHYNLGLALDREGRTQEAIAQYDEALRLKPNYVEAHNNLGCDLDAEGRTKQAIAQYDEALRLRPNYAEAHYNLGNALNAEGRTSDAIAQYEEALRLRPEMAEAHFNLGCALEKTAGRLGEAIAQYEEALRLRPDYFEVRCNLGDALDAEGRTQEAIAQFKEALRLKPDSAAIHFNLAGVLLKTPGGAGDAEAELETVLRLQPGNDVARQILARLRASSP